jgi:hypothetical protein
MKTIARLHGIMVLAMALVLSSGCVSAPKGLTQAEAVQRAEIFIIENGYTDLPATKAKLVPESLEFFWDDKDTMLQQRHDTLERKAVDSGGGKDVGWSVVFRYAHHPEENVYRVVLMNFDGSHIRVEHQDVIKAR